MIPPSAINLSDTWPTTCGFVMREVLPVFHIKRACMLSRIPSWTNRLVDHSREVVEKVLRSDSERFNAELVAAGEDLKQGVVKKYKFVVVERSKVSGYLVDRNSVGPLVPQFLSAMLRLETAAEKVKKDARTDVQKQRIKR